jgi:hypothetical protein
MNCGWYPVPEVIKICQEKNDFVSTGIRVAPSLVRGGIEKRGHQSIIVRRGSLRVLGFKDAGALKLGEALKLIARKTPQEIINTMPICRDRAAKKGTDQGRARGDSCQN